jgi:hypothetical protein
MKSARKQNLVAIPDGVEVTAVGLRIKARLSYSQWSNLVGGLQRVHRSILWLIGDAIVWGEDHFSEEFSQAISEYSRGAQYNAAWVSRKIEISRRRETLSWSHHAEVAMLGRAEQDRFLQEAIDHHWGVHELRAAVRLFRNPPPKLDFHDVADGPDVVPEEPEFAEMESVRPSYGPEPHEYEETGEQIIVAATERSNIEADFVHLLRLCKALRSAEKEQSEVDAARLRAALDVFIASHSAG